MTSHDAHADEAAAHHHTPEEIRAEMRKYWIILGALGMLTIITVGVRYVFDLSVGWTIVVAMIIACIKGSLVAAFFMHLISEKKLIYSVLVITVIFFIFLIGLPLSHYADRLR